MIPTQVSILTPAFAAVLFALSPVHSAAYGGSQESQPAPFGERQIELERDGGLTRLRVGSGPVFHQTLRPVEDARLVEVPASASVVALWNERGAAGLVPHYAVSLDGQDFARARETSYELHLKRATFDPAEGAPDFGASPLPGDGELWLVQFVCPPLEAFVDALRALGAEVHHFVPLHGRIVHMEHELVAAVSALPYVRWVGPYHPEYRLEDYLLERLAGDELRPSLRYQVQVLERGPRQKELVARRITGMGGTIDALIPEGFLLEATMGPEQLAAVAAMDEVLFIDRWSPPEEDLNIVRSVGGADFLTGVSGFTGQGVRGEVMDGNVRTSHAAFQSNPILLHGPNSGSMSHGTSTTGCVFGDGTAQPQARGLLPDGQPIFADYGHLTNRYTHTAQLLQAPYFAVFQSNSWGSSLTTQYNTTSMQMDDILFDLDIVILQSQSNSGTQSSRPQAWSKNILSVGALRHQNTATLADDSWSGSGSIGPAADGRIKPDISFWYDSIWTTSSSSDTAYTTTFGGTSAATPCTAGYIGLIQQMWSEGVFGNAPSGSTVFERRAKASTARALLVNTANQYPFEGTDHDLTRVHQGWGLPDVKQLYELRERIFVVDGDQPLKVFQAATFQLVVEPGEPALKATMVYIDPPGTTSASLHRINDLSLRVTSPTGTTFWGNNGLLAGNWSVPGGSSNTKDVIENVFVPTPRAGTWLIEVLADEVHQDAYPQTPEADVAFALVVTGVQQSARRCPRPTTYCTAKPTSSGSTPAIGWTGDPSVATNDFRIVLSGGMPNQFAVPFWSASSAATPFMGGTLCVAPPVERGTPQPLDFLGDGSFPLDISTKLPGQTEYFQVWFRDRADPTGFGVGLSDGLGVTYCN